MSFVLEAVNDVPEVSNESVVVEPNSLTVSLDVLGDDVDADGDTLELVSVSADRAPRCRLTRRPARSPTHPRGVRGSRPPYPMAGVG